MISTSQNAEPWQVGTSGGDPRPPRRAGFFLGRPPVPRCSAAVLRPARSWRAWLHQGIRRLHQDRFVVVGSSQTQRTGPGLPPERAAEPVML